MNLHLVGYSFYLHNLTRITIVFLVKLVKLVISNYYTKMINYSYLMSFLFPDCSYEILEGKISIKKRIGQDSTLL